MAKVSHEIVEYDGGWARRVGDDYSETFPSHEFARNAGERAAGDTTGILYEDKPGRRDDEVVRGDDRPRNQRRGLSVLASERTIMATHCKHMDGIRDVTPSALGCEECLKTGDEWVHLRICRTCGHVGCCDDSKNKHATKHFNTTHHPIIEGYDPPEGWGWCYVDDIMFDLSDRMTPHNGPIPRYY